MNRLFCSDLHLGHKLAARLRGYRSVEDHDDHIIETLKSSCKNKRDLLWILGDVAMTHSSLQRLLEVRCKKILVMGNHDQEGIMEYVKIFDKVYGFYKYKGLWLSHCPIHPQEMLRVKANVHGHIHKGAKTEDIGFPYINVNWDFHRRPLTFEEIKERVETCN